MIVIKLEMWPGGNASRAYEIGRSYIFNDAKKTNVDPKRGDYVAVVCRRGNNDFEENLRGGATRMGHAQGDLEPELMNDARLGKVENYPRLTYNVWRLIIRALRSAFPEEK